MFLLSSFLLSFFLPFSLLSSPFSFFSFYVSFLHYFLPSFLAFFLQWKQCNHVSSQKSNWKRVTRTHGYFNRLGHEQFLAWTKYRVTSLGMHVPSTTYERYVNSSYLKHPKSKRFWEHLHFKHFSKISSPVTVYSILTRMKICDLCFSDCVEVQTGMQGSHQQKINWHMLGHYITCTQELGSTTSS